MRMTIDLAMNNLNGILKEATESKDSVCYVTENDAETLQVAIDTMKKYQIIVNDLKACKQDSMEFISVGFLKEIIDGNED